MWREYCGRGYGAYSTLGGVASTVWVWQWYVQHSRGCGKHCVGCGNSVYSTLGGVANIEWVWHSCVGVAMKAIKFDVWLRTEVACPSLCSFI